MKSMNIAASSELVSRLSSHRRVVALGDTDFTDVAAVVITAADSRSGILALLKRTGFHLPVFLYSEHAVELPAGVTAVINGNEQQWLELESAACQYEENLLPPFYDTLTQYVEMATAPLLALDINMVRFLKSILPDAIFTISLVRTSFAPICVTLT